MRHGLGLVLFIALVVSMAACSEGKVESKTPPRRAAIPVAVAAVEQKAIPLLVQAMGSVEAYSVVSVRAQVGGELEVDQHVLLLRALLLPDADDTAE